MAEFSDNGSTATSPIVPQTLGSNTGGDAITDAAIPALYGLWKVNPDLALGVALNVPYGLQTDYDSDWIGRYHALKSDLRTISVQPAIAYQVTPRLSLGAGINIQHASAELTKAVDFGSIVNLASTGAIATSATPDGMSKVEGDDLSYGYTASALYELSEQTRIGAHYRSRVHHELEGDLTITNVPGLVAGNVAFADGKASAELITPDSAHLGIYHQMNDEVAVMADVAWTNWSLFRNLVVTRNDGSVASSKAENWEDAWFYSIGASYTPAPLSDWTFNIGAAYDQSPVQDEFRTPRVPDADRMWVSAGAAYRPMENLELSLGYTHIFVDKASISDTESTAVGAATVTHSLIGSYDSHVDIVAIGATYRF